MTSYEHERTIRLERVLGRALALDRVHSLHAGRVHRRGDRVVGPMGSARLRSVVSLLSRRVVRDCLAGSVGVGRLELSAVSARTFLRVTAISVMSRRAN